MADRLHGSSLLDLENSQKNCENHVTPITALETRHGGGEREKKQDKKREENQDSVNQSCLPQYVRLRLVSPSRNRQ